MKKLNINLKQISKINNDINSSNLKNIVIDNSLPSTNTNSVLNDNIYDVQNLKDIERTDSLSYSNNFKNISTPIIKSINTQRPIIKIDTNENSYSKKNSPIINPKNIKYFEDDKISLKDNIVFDKYINKKDDIIKRIEKHKEDLKKKDFIISVKYDNICYKYNTISLTIMILSTVSTFVEAIRLTLTEYMKNMRETLIIDVDTFTLSINIFMLILGTVITILSSIVRFKNYREIMEKLKNYQNSIIKYRSLYNKQIDLIELYTLNNKELDDERYEELIEKVKDYNKEINENINILEDIKNIDKIKLQKYKYDIDIKLEKMKMDKEIKILKNNNIIEIETIRLNNEKIDKLNKLKINDGWFFRFKKMFYLNSENKDVKINNDINDIYNERNNYNEDTMKTSNINTIMTKNSFELENI